mgnify:CR=1 FL=1
MFKNFTNECCKLQLRVHIETDQRQRIVSKCDTQTPELVYGKVCKGAQLLDSYQSTWKQLF